MVTIKTDILLQDSLYEEASVLANQMQISQSELFVLAIEEYLGITQLTFAFWWTLLILPELYFTKLLLGD